MSRRRCPGPRAPRRAPRTLLACLALGGTLCATHARALELWVDHDSMGGPCDDARDRTTVAQQTPWCTLAAAGVAVQAGDTVHVRQGTYSEVQTCVACNDNSVLQLVSSGLQDAPIRFVAEPGEVVRLTADGGAVHGLQIQPTWDNSVVPRFVEIAGFDISGFANDCVKVANTSDVRLWGLEVHHCNGGAIELHGSSRIVLEHSAVHDNPTHESTSAVDLYLCLDGNVVRGNFIWANTDEDAADTEGHGITMDTCEDAGGALIENNVIWDNEGWGISIYQSDGSVIRNNTCWQNGRRAGAGELSVLGDHHAIHNNILVPRAGELSLNIRERPDYPVDFNTITEDFDILWAPTHQDVAAWVDGTRGTVADYQAGNPAGWGANTLGVDPMLVAPGIDPASANFGLQQGSPAIDSGDDTNAAATDVLGATRPFDGDGDSVAHVDRGAYEYGAPPGEGGAGAWPPSGGYGATGGSSSGASGPGASGPGASGPGGNPADAEADSGCGCRAPGRSGDTHGSALVPLSLLALGGGRAGARARARARGR